MSAKTTEMLARAAGTPLCDLVIIGVKPNVGLYIDHSGTTIASFLLWLELAKREALAAWDEAADLHRRGEEAA